MQVAVAHHEKISRIFTDQLKKEDRKLLRQRTFLTTLTRCESGHTVTQYCLPLIHSLPGDLKSGYNSQWANLWTYSLVKEYVASLLGLYENNGAVSCVDNYFLFICCTELAYQLHPSVSQGVTCNIMRVLCPINGKLHSS